MQAPILGLMGGADQGIPQTDVDAFDEALTAAGVDHELVVYPGAPHSFFDRKQEAFQDASDDAWRRVLGFITDARLRPAARTASAVLLTEGSIPRGQKRALTPGDSAE